jgi:hypothetical protein
MKEIKIDAKFEQIKTTIVKNTIYIFNQNSKNISTSIYTYNIEKQEFGKVLYSNPPTFTNMNPICYENNFLVINQNEKEPNTISISEYSEKRNSWDSLFSIEKKKVYDDFLLYDDKILFYKKKKKYIEYFDLKNNCFEKMEFETKLSNVNLKILGFFSKSLNERRIRRPHLFYKGIFN